jgi:hypothetical protein
MVQFPKNKKRGCWAAFRLVRGVFRLAYTSQAVADLPIGDKRGWVEAPK